MRIIYSLLENNDNYILIIKELAKQEYSGIVSNLIESIFALSENRII